MADALIIRAAEADDIVDVLRLYAQPDLDNGVVLSEDEAQTLHGRFARYPDYTLYVAERGGVIVGSFALLVMDNLGHLGAPSGIVEDVAVDPDYQSHGIGQAMMAYAVERCRAKGCYKVMLSSNARRARAHAFYERIGFERHGYSFRLHLLRGAA